MKAKNIFYPKLEHFVFKQIKPKEWHCAVSEGPLKIHTFIGHGKTAIAAKADWKIDKIKTSNGIVERRDLTTTLVEIDDLKFTIYQETVLGENMFEPPIT